MENVTKVEADIAHANMWEGGDEGEASVAKFTYEKGRASYRYIPHDPVLVFLSIKEDTESLHKEMQVDLTFKYEIFLRWRYF